VRTFDTVEELRQALPAVGRPTDTSWLIERHGFQTPAAVRHQLAPAALAARGEITEHLWAGTPAIFSPFVCSENDTL
jgi:hypothetical protein